MKLMLKDSYAIYRSIFSWLFKILFLITTPIVLLLSLGYTFDIPAKSLVKTGALFIKTVPEDVSIFLNDKKLDVVTPEGIRNVVPGDYSVTLQKKGFFSYKTLVTVERGAVANIDVVLVPIITVFNKSEYPFTIFNYISVSSVFDTVIIAFTDTGIYTLNQELKVDKKISNYVFSEKEAHSLKGVLLPKSWLIVWHEKAIYILPAEETGKSEATTDSAMHTVYEARDEIKRVFVGLEERYLIVQDGNYVYALDIENTAAYFQVAKLQSKEGDIYYQNASDVLFMYEKDPSGKKTVVLSKNLKNNLLTKIQSFANERTKNKTNP